MLLYNKIINKLNIQYFHISKLNISNSLNLNNTASEFE